MQCFSFLIIILLCSGCTTTPNDLIKIPQNISEEQNDSLKMELLVNEIDINSQKLSFIEKEAYFKMAEEIAVRQKYNIRYYSILGLTGDLYHGNNQNDKAILFYKKAIALKETLDLAIEEEVYARTYNALSSSILDKADDSTTIDKKELYEEAILHSKKSIEIAPKLSHAWLLLGNANIKLANERIAIASKTDATSKQTLYEEALSDFEKAIVAYEKVQELRPNHPDLSINMGVLYRDRGNLLGRYLGNLEEAILSLETSLYYVDKDFECFRLLGVANGVKSMQLQQKGLKIESSKASYKAVEYFEKALDLHPNSVTILYNLEVAYRQLGKVDKAEECRGRWEGIDPDYEPAG